MKIKLAIIGIILILLTFFLWSSHNVTKPSSDIAPPTSASENNNPTTASNSSALIAKTASSQAIAPAQSNQSPEERLKALETKTDAGKDEWRTPIEFYGRVIDDDNAAVSGAKIDFDCNDLSSTGTSYYHTQSDANGFFSLKGITGKLLGVNVSKEGYYSYDAHGQNFYYAGENHNFVPDANNPVVFRLKKKGEGANLIKADYPPFAHVAQLKHDGTPVELNLYEGKEVAIGQGQLKLEFQRDVSDKNAKIYDWKLQLTISGGGLIGTDEQFPFTAPTTDYQSPVIFDMPINTPDWKGRINTNYYFRLSDGKYGRMSFEFLPWNGVFTIHSLINPSGSQNLEPKQ